MEINNDEITHTVNGVFGETAIGRDTLYTMPIQVGFATKANCRRGDGFVRLNIFPLRNWQIRFGAARRGITYAAQFRDAVNELFDNFASMTDADDSDNEAAWTKSLWPAAQDGEMAKRYLSAVSVEPAKGNLVFERVSTVNVSSPRMMGIAEKRFDAGSMQQKLTSELNKTGYKVDPSSEVSIRHQIAIERKAYNIRNDNFENVDTNGEFYVDGNILQVGQWNVVFKFNGELRRASGVWLSSEIEAAVAITTEQNHRATELVESAITSFAKHAHELRE